MYKAFMQPLMSLAINATEKASGESGVNTDTEEKRIGIIFLKRREILKSSTETHLCCAWFSLLLVL